MPGTGPARWGWLTAVAGMVGLTVTEVVAISAADDATDSDRRPPRRALRPDLAALGVGLLMLGVSIARARTWAGWRRWVVLALGVWVFVPMFPALVVTPTDGARLAIGGWMLLFAALGVALLSAPARPGSAPRA